MKNPTNALKLFMFLTAVASGIACGTFGYQTYGNYDGQGYIIQSTYEGGAIGCGIICAGALISLAILQSKSSD